eukprot:scaffold318531_cov14-Prasinocladus_malaysianus.AAC.1
MPLPSGYFGKCQLCIASWIFWFVILPAKYRRRAAAACFRVAGLKNQIPNPRDQQRSRTLHGYLAATASVTRVIQDQTRYGIATTTVLVATSDYGSD